VAATEQFEAFSWVPEITIEHIKPPRRIAPFAAAITADVVSSDGNNTDLGSGKFILLHDPAGKESWDGDFRCVTFAQADISFDMVHDPSLPQVGWAWFLDALRSHSANFAEPNGTVSVLSSTTFAERATGHNSVGELEIRASWTPQFDPDDDVYSLTHHLAAWQDLLRMMTDIAPVPEEFEFLSRRAGE
jgi:hypothetical protein